MKVQRFKLSALLAPFVRECIIIESQLGTDSNILPDTSMVMAFRYKGNVQRMEGELTEALPANGLVKIKDLAVSLHISQDPFEKRFRAQVGSGPYLPRIHWGRWNKGRCLIRSAGHRPDQSHARCPMENPGAFRRR